MKTRNAKELASIIILLLSQDYESVQLGISLFATHYLITNYPKNKKFKVSLKYKGYNPPSEYCRSYSNNSEIFNKNQFIRMLLSKSVNIRKKTCAIINFIYDNIDPRYLKDTKNKKIKNPHYNTSLSSNLWGSFLDTLKLEDIVPKIWKTCRKTENPLSKKKYREQVSALWENHYSSSKSTINTDLLDDLKDCGIDNVEKYNFNNSWAIIRDYEHYLDSKFKKKGKILIRSLRDLETLFSSDSFKMNEYYIDFSNF